MTNEPSVSVFDDRRCKLGEGPMWHPERGQPFWFDIMGRRLLTVDGSGPHEWEFDDYVSAAGWVDADRLLIASQTALTLFDLRDGTSGESWLLEADDALTRSNDGRADPMGGFWIGTMSIDKPRNQRGAFYRFYKGEIRLLYDQIGVTNAICFAPDGRTAYLADTDLAIIWKQALDPDGWPLGERQVHIDVSAEKLRPDGAVVDEQGNLWNAQWGASRVACYDPAGDFVRAVNLPPKQTSCPAFIGARLDRMMVTSAGEGLDGAADGLTFVIDGLDAVGQAEHRVVLA